MNDNNIFDELIAEDPPRSCPVVEVFNKIGGRYEEENLDPDMIVGGGDSGATIFDDANYYCDSVAIEVARIEVRKPPIEKLRLHYRRIAQPIIAAGTIEGLIEHILRETAAHQTMIEMSHTLYNLINKLNGRIMLAAMVAAKQGKCLDMALPCTSMLPISSPTPMMMTAAHKYLMGLDIDCIATKSKVPEIELGHVVPHQSNTKRIVLDHGGDMMSGLRSIVATVEEARLEAVRREKECVKFIRSCTEMIEYIGGGIKFKY
jgi:hypothetical protein